MSSTERGLIPVTELKQWWYCPRIVHYHRVAGLYPPMTRKMKEALDAQDQFEKLEVRRRLEKYGFANGRREFGVWLNCAGIGLSGRLDLLISNDQRATVVDFKLTAAEPGANLSLQLAAYGMMVEEARGLVVETAFLYRIPDDRLFPIELGAELRRGVVEAEAAIRRLGADAALPEATPVRARCEECEFANFCGDVW